MEHMIGTIMVGESWLDKIGCMNGGYYENTEDRMLLVTIRIAGSKKHIHSWSSQRVTTKRLIILISFGTKQQKIDHK